MDECISQFEDAVRRHDGEWWAPTSEFPCSKEALVEELIERRHAAQYGDEYRRLAGLLIALTRFVPDGDLALATPYVAEGGAISGQARPDEADEAARVRSYEVFEAHRAAGKALIHRIGVDPPHRLPITSAPYAVSGVKDQGAGAQWYLLTLLMLLPERLRNGVRSRRHP